MKKLFSFTLLSFLFMFGIASAETFSFDGDITYHNDVIEIDFTLDTDTADVTVWTDSFNNAENFDPITAVWKLNGTQWELVGENDDDDTLWSGQTYYDSGLFFSSLTAGEYKFTIATYNNWASGTTLSDGFSFDDETPILMSAWTPVSEGTGTYYNVHLDGVSSASVPVPGTIVLLGFGLLGLTGVGRKNKK